MFLSRGTEDGFCDHYLSYLLSTTPRTPKPPINPTISPISEISPTLTLLLTTPLHLPVGVHLQQLLWGMLADQSFYCCYRHVMREKYVTSLPLHHLETGLIPLPGDWLSTAYYTRIHIYIYMPDLTAEPAPVAHHVRITSMDRSTDTMLGPLRCSKPGRAVHKLRRLLHRMQDPDAKAKEDASCCCGQHAHEGLG